MGCGSSAVPQHARAENNGLATSHWAAATLLGSPVSPKLSGGYTAKPFLSIAERQVDEVGLVGADTTHCRSSAVAQHACAENIGVSSSPSAAGTLLGGGRQLVPLMREECSPSLYES